MSGRRSAWGGRRPPAHLLGRLVGPHVETRPGRRAAAVRAGSKPAPRLPPPRPAVGRCTPPAVKVGRRGCGAASVDVPGNLVQSFTSKRGGSRHAPLAQLAEQRTLNPRVRGSSPWRRTRSDLRESRRVTAFRRVPQYVPHAWPGKAERPERLPVPGMSGISCGHERSPSLPRSTTRRSRPWPHGEDRSQARERVDPQPGVCSGRVPSSQPPRTRRGRRRFPGSHSPAVDQAGDGLPPFGA